MCTKKGTDYVCIVTINLLLSIYIVADKLVVLIKKKKRDKLVVNHLSSLTSFERSGISTYLGQTIKK